MQILIAICKFLQKFCPPPFGALKLPKQRMVKEPSSIVSLQLPWNMSKFGHIYPSGFFARSVSFH